MIPLILIVVILIVVILVMGRRDNYVESPPSKRTVSFNDTTEILEYNTITGNSIRLTRGKLSPETFKGGEEKDTLSRVYDVVKLVGHVIEDEPEVLV